MILTHASRELFCQSADERFETLDLLHQHCVQDKQRSKDRWHSPMEIRSIVAEGRLDMQLGETAYRLNDWSFSQLCRLANVSKETLNKLSPDTASRALAETLPEGGNRMSYRACRLKLASGKKPVHSITSSKDWSRSRHIGLASDHKTP